LDKDCLMSLEENKSIVRRLVEAENSRRFAVLEELISPNYVNQTNQIRSTWKETTYHTSDRGRSLKR